MAGIYQKILVFIFLLATIIIPGVLIVPHLVSKTHPKTMTTGNLWFFLGVFIFIFLCWFYAFIITFCKKEEEEEEIEGSVV